MTTIAVIQTVERSSGSRRGTRTLGAGAGVLLCMGMCGDAFGDAYFIQHVRSGADPRAGAATHTCPLDQKYVDILAPVAGQAVTLRWKIENEDDTDRTRVYYTTDGSDPIGAF